MQNVLLEKVYEKKASDFFHTDPKGRKNSQCNNVWTSEQMDEIYV